MPDCDEFYHTRDHRTRAYTGNEDLIRLADPVGITVGKDAAHTLPGQMAALSMLNLVARVHRNIRIRAPHAALTADAIHAPHATTLVEALKATADAIDPCGRHTICRSTVGAVPEVSVGTASEGWKVGANGATGILSQNDVAFTEDDAALLGAPAAACLGAAALMHLVCGWPVRAVAVSVWDLQECTDDPQHTGPTTIGPINLGRVATIGAGAVSAAMAFWLHPFQITQPWTVIDPDIAKLHNANRTMSVLPEHTEWSRREPRAKAPLVSRLIRAQPKQKWYHDWTPAQRPDLVIPLANEHSVRHHVGQRGDPLIIHATTSRDWEAQLHRHIPGRDDCIGCRFSELSDSAFECGAGRVFDMDRTDRSEASDAALPFLSAAAGLLLAATLVRLSETGEVDGDPNWWGWRFLGGRNPLRATSMPSCTKECNNRLPLEVVRRVGAERFTPLLP